MVAVEILYYLNIECYFLTIPINDVSYSNIFNILTPLIADGTVSRWLYRSNS